MVKKTVTYTDFDGEKVEEPLYFHLSKMELLELNNAYGCRVDKYINKILEEHNGTKLGLFFSDLILRSYGKKSEDGKRFVKSPEAKKEFSQSIAFQTLINELTASSEAIEQFVDSLLDSVE